MAKLVKSIYTGADVTALGEVTSADSVDIPCGVNVTGNVGIGTSSPNFPLSFPLGTGTVIGQYSASAHLAGNVGSIGLVVSDGGGTSGVFVHNTHDGTYSSQDIRFLTAQGGLSSATERLRIDNSGTVDVKVRAKGTITTDNDLSFDMAASNFFKCTPSSTGTLTFTNITAGQSGNIWLDNSAAVVISAASTTYISAADLTKINSAGVYFLSYYSDGTNVMVSASSALTSAGA